jgi:ferrous-iron efflux pump FieF
MSTPFKKSNHKKTLLVAALFCFFDVLLTGSASYFSNSITILSDFLKESADFLSVVAALVTLSVMKKGSFENFAYGIGKLENLVSIFISMLMGLSACFILSRAVSHLIHPEKSEGTLPGIAIFFVSAIFGFWMSQKNNRLFHETASPILQTQAHLWRSKAWLDCLMASALLVALLFSHYEWSYYLDPILSLVGVVFLIDGAWNVSKSSINELLDASLEEASQLVIMRKLTEHFDDYESVNKIRTRRSGAKVHIEIFLGFAHNLSMSEVQKVIDKLTDSIQKEFTGAEITVIASAS